MLDSGIWFLSGVARWLKEDDTLAFYAARTEGQVRFRVSSEALARLAEYDLMYLDAPQASDAFNRFEIQLHEIARRVYSLAPADDVDLSDAVRDAAAPHAYRPAAWSAKVTETAGRMALA